MGEKVTSTSCGNSWYYTVVGMESPSFATRKQALDWLNNQPEGSGD